MDPSDSMTFASVSPRRHRFHQDVRGDEPVSDSTLQMFLPKIIVRCFNMHALNIKNLAFLLRILRLSSLLKGLPSSVEGMPLITIEVIEYLWSSWPIPHLEFLPRSTSPAPSSARLNPKFHSHSVCELALLFLFMQRPWRDDYQFHSCLLSSDLVRPQHPNQNNPFCLPSSLLSSAWSPGPQPGPHCDSNQSSLIYFPVWSFETIIFPLPSSPPHFLQPLHFLSNIQANLCLFPFQLSIRFVHAKYMLRIIHCEGFNDEGHWTENTPLRGPLCS